MSVENKFVEEVTAEQAAQSVLAAYDSVNLIAELRAKAELSEEESATVTRNVEHISIMLGKEWFVNALTTEQKSELDALI
jgi:hypothetical protein